MRLNRCKTIFFILLFGILCACGESQDNREIVLTGTIEGQALDEHPDKPILVAVVRNNQAQPLGSYALSDIIAMVSADKATRTFHLDLSESGLEEGDEINLVAFVDKNFSNGLPNPDAGDTVGIYIDQQTYSPAYMLQSGLNSGFHIRVNRLIRPFKTEIAGKVEGDLAGDLLIVIYAGQIDALDFAHLDIDKVIGYTRQYKGTSDFEYTLELLPYPEDLQTDSVVLVALLDDQGVGLPAPGNLVGFHMDPTGGVTPNFFPLVTSRDNVLTSMDIRMQFPDASGAQTAELRIPTPSGDTILLNGRITPPADFDPEQGAVFALVAQAENPTDIFSSPLTAVKYFYKLPRGSMDFSLDLSDSGLSLEDEVMVLGLWDKDYQNGFPDPTPGDVTGYMQNKSEMSYSILLSQWQDSWNPPENWDFSINKRFYNRRAAVQFEIHEGEDTITPMPGEQFIAIAIERRGLDIMHGSLDMDHVVGMAHFIAGLDGPPYTCKILPVIYEDIEVAERPFLRDVYILALLDNRPANGKPDRGENIGVYARVVPFGFRTFDVLDGLQMLDGRVIFFPDFVY